MTTPSPLSPVVGEAQASPTQRFRKKPVEIQAMQWTSADAAFDIIQWADGSVDYDQHTSGPSDPETGDDWGRLAIETLEGPLVATPRDWIIRGIQGEFYPCKPDIFAATYDVAPDPLELTPAEQAAANADLHYATCGVQSYDCQQCVTVLTSVHRYVKAAESVIAEEVDREADAFYVEQLCQFIYDHADTSEAVMHAEQFSVDELAELVNRWQPRAWQNFLWKRERTDGIDSDGAPVAAALDPTPIPDGEAAHQ